jgi:hypothetical protein
LLPVKTGFFDYGPVLLMFLLNANVVIAFNPGIGAPTQGRLMKTTSEV